ncbi:retrotransposable element Tf2 155 kDa protein type 2, partial [Trifolium medium]|nr:retrotransposable element Tf2 155 kDa protein type 2 [Trifolium medium]
MKLAADNHRREVQYQVDDWVMVKLRLHRQKTATGVPYSKLGKR